MINAILVQCIVVAADNYSAPFIRIYTAIVVYCSSKKCHSSEEVARRLREEVGLKTVYVLRGGWEAWKGARP